MRLLLRLLMLAASFSFAGSFAPTFVPLAYAQSTSEIAAMQRDYRRPPPRAIENKALVELGRALFFAPQLSASGKTSCASCHFPEIGWGVTEARSRNDSGKLTSRKSQPLIGLGHSGKALVGWDGRSATLEDQAKASIATGSMSMRETATPVKIEVIEERIRSDAAYVAKFAGAMPGVAINIDSIVKAIAEFERTLEPGVSPFDRWIEGDQDAISASAPLQGGGLRCRGQDLSACQARLLQLHLGRSR